MARAQGDACALAALPRFPGYQLLRPIGRGGMAEVWLAVQVSSAREVALKLLAQDMARDDTLRERFLQEARIAAQLHHLHQDRCMARIRVQ